MGRSRQRLTRRGGMHNGSLRDSFRSWADAIDRSQPGASWQRRCSSAVAVARSRARSTASLRTASSCPDGSRRSMSPRARRSSPSDRTHGRRGLLGDGRHQPDGLHCTVSDGTGKIDSVRCVDGQRHLRPGLRHQRHRDRTHGRRPGPERRPRHALGGGRGADLRIPHAARGQGVLRGHRRHAPPARTAR